MSDMEFCMHEKVEYDSEKLHEKVDGELMSC